MKIQDIHSEMRSKNSFGNAARLLVCGLLLWSFAGRAAAQSDPTWVIYNGAYYLAHVYDEGTGDYKLVGVTTLNPDCIWYSSNTHNYYFYDSHHSINRFIQAPIDASQDVTLSPNNALPTDLELSEGYNYYFANWDWGLSRGVETTASHDNENPCPASDLSDDGSECWTVYWVEYYGSPMKWQTSSTHHYNPSQLSAQFRRVRVTDHAATIGNETGGLGNLADIEMEYNDSENLSISITSYSFTTTPAYTTFLIGELDNCSSNWATRTCDTSWIVHNYYGDADHLATIPNAVASGTISTAGATYAWTITGEGASYLTLDNANTATPTLRYNSINKSGDKTATLTVTVTYTGGYTQVRTATVTVKTQCGNPLQAAAPVVTYDGVTVSWVPTTTSYNVYYRKVTIPESAWSTAAEGVTGTSYTIRNLDYGTEYQYRVAGVCVSPDGDYPSPPYGFTTKETPGMLVFGSVFGGGRMANVNGKTEVIVINCDTIGAVYGGNDIAGSVGGADGSTIILGVNSGDTYDSYGTTNSTIGVTIGSVYGGGNGYYVYDGYNPGVAVGTTVLTGKTFTTVANVGGSSIDAAAGSIPIIKKTAINVESQYVIVDSLFGGAKNAFIDDATAYKNVAITINDGTIYSVFGGNNYGGTLKAGSTQQIDVNWTTTNYSAAGLVNGKTTGFGRDFGIRYLYGGGNKVAGQNVAINIYGGQIDTLFGGGNAADVEGTVTVTVNCSFAASTAPNWNKFGNTITKSVYSYSDPKITIDNTYTWNGKGLYNVRALFGGNNAADMAQVPTITLTQGSVGTVYGGGNSGRMTNSSSTTTINGNTVHYSTHVVANANKLFVDYIYGGCQKSDVLYSTWVEIMNGYIGTVYGGCNISGDVGSVRVNLGGGLGPGDEDYQVVRGGTYVVVTGGTVQKNVFAGSNGFYHCSEANNSEHTEVYRRGINYDDEGELYIGLTVPTHNETTVIVDGSATIYGNVYAGGNLACVGFSEDWNGNSNNYPLTVGFSTVTINGGLVAGNVFGGGNMASVYGNNAVTVTGGTIGGALYGGNDRLGRVGMYHYRVLPANFEKASDNQTQLISNISSQNVNTYISITGEPKITTVYGGGNGDYDYTENSEMQYCNNLTPIQTNTFVDINIDGDGDAEIGTVYGGGDGVTVEGFIKVFVNVNNPDDKDDIGTIFGGNNKGDLEIAPEIILLHGQVNTVYGGCNQGKITGDHTVTLGSTSFEHTGSYVYLRNSYAPGSQTADAVVSGAVYGGCRMNDVNHNSLVYVDGGNHSNAALFGGCDISGDVLGTSQVVVMDGTVGNVYGGGNGNYTYDPTALTVYSGNVLIATGSYTAPYCNETHVEMGGGTAGNLYGGGFAGECGETYVQMDNGTVSGSIYGGGNQAGVTTAGGNPGTSTIVMNNGTVRDAVYGGCNAAGNIDGAVAIYVNDGTVGTGDANDGIFGGGYGASTTTSGNVTVNIGNASAANADACPVINADIYGGSALGSVNTNTDNTTTVNIINGTVNGNVYGGGLGQAVLDAHGYRDNTADSLLAVVNGNVVVNIGTSEQTSNFVTVNGDVFGCNNLAGSPAGTVTVNVYRTAHTSGNNGNSVPTGSQLTLEQMASTWSSVTAPDDEGSYNGYYAINAVYGGGNLAHKTSSGLVSVNIWNCDNSIKYVYGGGNAANILGSTAVTVYGGHIYQVFGGGNGFGTGNPGANITGTASTTIYGGYMHYVFGGSNNRGTIGTQNVLISSRSGEGVCFSPVIYNFFAGGNMATSTGDLSTTIDNCDVKFYNLYGGANQANITGNVTLNVRGGTYMNIYGGSNAANITGNVALNFYGGTATNIFGGNNTSGTISGSIKVIVDVVDDHCPTALENVYGGGNLADYTAPDSASKNYPRVDIRNANISGSVYGGGKGVDNANKGIVTGNPQVIFHATSNSRSVACGYIYGGGNAGPVTGNPNILIDGGTVRQSVFGGGYGARAQVTGSTTVLVKGPANIGENVYGGGNAGIVTGNTNVQIGDAE